MSPIRTPLATLSARTQAAWFIRSNRRTRGVTMLEYVIMAVIVVALGVLLRDQLTQIFNAMLTRLRSFVGR